MSYFFFQEYNYFTLYNNFNAFKFALDAQIIEMFTSVQITNTNLVKIKPFECPIYQKDEQLSTFAFFTPMLISVGFMFTTLITVGNIVFEKSSKMKVQY